MTLARALPVLAALILSSCAGGAEPASGSPAPGTDYGEFASLAFEYRDGVRPGVRRATLRCPSGPGAARAGGYLASGDPAALCRRARRLGRFLAGRADPTRPCTLIYGGPQTARVRGSVGPRRVDRRLSRTDGCGVADWDRLGPLLPPVRASRMLAR